MRDSQSNTRAYCAHFGGFFECGRTSSFGLSRMTGCARRKMSCVSFIEFPHSPSFHEASFAPLAHVNTNDDAGCNLRSNSLCTLDRGAYPHVSRTHGMARGNCARVPCAILEPEASSFPPALKRACSFLLRFENLLKDSRSAVTPRPQLYP